MRALPASPLSRTAAILVALFALALSLLAPLAAQAAGEPTGPLATARYAHAAARLPDGRLLVTGGHRASGSISSMTASVEIYDPATGLFSAAAPMAVARGEHAAATLPDGRVLVVGGLGLAGPLASAEIYDPASATWSATGNLTTARRATTALTLPDGRVLVVGGDDTATTAELFDPATGTFTPTGSLTASRQGRFVAALLQDGRVLLAGGADATWAYVSTAETWDPATGAWTATGSMAFAREGATATTLPDGRVLVAGGRTSGSLASAIAVPELYDPASGTFSATGALNVPRSDHRAALLGDGNVVVVGGYSGLTSYNEASIERYDVVAGTWRNAGLMAAIRSGHTASSLANGDVLVAGGTTSSGMIASAEIVDPFCISATPTISPASASFPYTGGTGSVAVTHLPGCYWRVSRFPSWATITSGSEGTGSGTVNYSVSENTETYGRGMTAIVADNDYYISQPVNPCAGASLSPTSQSFSASGGSTTVSLSAGSTCKWTVAGAPPWMTITSGGTGSANIAYSVAANAGASRSATLTIAGRSLTVSQAGNPCLPAPTVSPTSQSFGSAGGSATAVVTAPSTCSWTIAGKPSWITSISGGTGNASVTITAAANAGAERSATFTIANNSYTVTQAANPCAGTTIAPTSASVGSAGGTADVAVNAPAACTWNVTGKPAWITSVSGGTGASTLTLTVAANSGAARSATLGIGGIAFTVSQEADPCYATASLSPTSQSFATAGGSGSFTVTQAAGCAWSVANVPAWITLTSPASGVGNGTVTYAVAANTGAARSATLGVAGRSYTVSQAAYTPPPSAYCASKGSVTSYEWIQQVSVAGTVRVTGRGTGYTDLTGSAAIPLAAGANAVTLTPGFSSASYTEHWRVWIDFNRDNVFSDSEMVFGGSGWSSAVGSITVPATALAGTTRMRVSMKYGSAPLACESFTYGEVEDYTVSIP